MAILSILVGLVFFLMAVAWTAFVLATSQSESPAIGFGLMVGFFPAVLGAMLIIPSTLIRVIYVMNKQTHQSHKEKVVLCIGLMVSVLYFIAFLDLVFS